MTENLNFFENWATDKLCTSKESWNHLEIDFLAKKQIYLKEVALLLSWIGWEITHWAERADMADIPFHLYKSKLGTFLWIW